MILKYEINFQLDEILQKDSVVVLIYYEKVCDWFVIAIDK